MMFLKFAKFNVSVVCIMAFATMAPAVAYQNAWDNPEQNMATGSSKPGYAQLNWSAGSVLPLKIRSGMVTIVSLPNGEKITDAVIGNTGLFQINAEKGDRTLYLSTGNQAETAANGQDTNLIVMGESGNKYIFYLRAVPVNTSDITYSQVDVVLDGNSTLPTVAGATVTGAGMNSIFNKKSANTSNTIGVDGEDYAWIKSMKIDPSEFRFDLDIFVPNPDDYVIAPERVWRDKVFTYIDFGDKVIAMTQRPVVSLLVEGGESPVGFRTDGEDSRLLIVEAVGDMILRSGQRIVCIKKREKPFLIADTASVMALAEANVAQSMMSNQSLNNVVYNDAFAVSGTPYVMDTTYNQINIPNMSNNVYTENVGQTSGLTMIPMKRETAGSYLPQTNVPIITSNQSGVAVELKSGTSVKELDDYWNDLLARFTAELEPYSNSVYFSVDAQGVGDLGSGASTARLYRLRVGPMGDIEAAQSLCDKLKKFNNSCSVVRIQ